jgi:hypothetical protein
MEKIEKMFLTPKWQEIKSMYEAGTNGSNAYGENFQIDGELDILTQHFIGYIGEITEKRGFDTILEGTKMDLWKERIWALIHNAGLLPEIAWKDERDDEEVNIKDTWEQNDDEFYVDLDELEKEIYG